MQVFDNDLDSKRTNTQYRRLLDGLRFARAAPVSCSVPTQIPMAICRASWANSGEIYKMERDGTVIGNFGHASKQLGGFQVVHMMDCRNPNQILVSEIESWRVQKLMLKPQSDNDCIEVAR